MQAKADTGGGGGLDDMLWPSNREVWVMDGHNNRKMEDNQGTGQGLCVTSLDYRSIIATESKQIEELLPEERAKKEFGKYLERVATSGIALRKKDGSGGVIVASKYNSRYFKEGRENIKKKLYARLPKVKKDGIHLILTVDMSREENQIVATKKIWKRWKGLRDWINMRRKRRGEDTINFCSALEFQKSGAPHLHVFMPGIKWLETQRELQKQWGSILWVKKAPSSVAGYVLKYVTKLKSENLHVLWASQARLYNVSRWFYCNLWKPSGEWEFLGFVRGEVIRNLGPITGAGPEIRHIKFAGDRDFLALSVWDSLCEV